MRSRRGFIWGTAGSVAFLAGCAGVLEEEQQDDVDPETPSYTPPDERSDSGEQNLDEREDISEEFGIAKSNYNSGLLRYQAAESEYFRGDYSSAGAQAIMASSDLDLAESDFADALSTAEEIEHTEAVSMVGDAHEIASNYLEAADLLEEAGNLASDGDTGEADPKAREARQIAENTDGYGIVSQEELDVALGLREPSDGEQTSSGSGSDGQQSDTGQDEPDLEPTPTHLDGIIGGTGENLGQGETVERQYDYSIGRDRWTYTSYVPRNLVEHYRNRTRIGEYGAYVSTPFDDQYIQDMADTFQESADSDRQAIEFARAFVQDLDYTSDEVSQGVGNYPQFPVETMFASEGDCEDTSILLSAIYSAMGYGTVLLGLWNAEHMAVGLLGEEGIGGTYYDHDGGRYYYVETTASGWQIGEMPDEITQTNAEIIGVDQYPALTFSWNISSRSGRVDTTLMVSNQGDGAASGVAVRGEFETRSGSTVAADEARIGGLGPREIGDATLEFDVPADQALRGRFSVITNGTLYDEATTDYYSP